MNQEANRAEIHSSPDTGNRARRRTDQPHLGRRRNHGASGGFAQAPLRDFMGEGALRSNWLLRAPDRDRADGRAHSLKKRRHSSTRQSIPCREFTSRTGRWEINGGSRTARKLAAPTSAGNATGFAPRSHTGRTGHITTACRGGFARKPRDASGLAQWSERRSSGRL